MDEQSAVTLLVALAQGMRLRIFRALAGAGPHGLTLGALSATLVVPASTLSFHLKEQTHAGLVTQQRDGRHLIDRPALDHMNALLAYRTAHCCHHADRRQLPDAAAVLRHPLSRHSAPVCPLTAQLATPTPTPTPTPRRFS